MVSLETKNLMKRVLIATNATKTLLVCYVVFLLVGLDSYFSRSALFFDIIENALIPTTTAPIIRKIGA